VTFHVPTALRTLLMQNNDKTKPTLDQIKGQAVVPDTKANSSLGPVLGMWPFSTMRKRKRILKIQLNIALLWREEGGLGGNWSLKMLLFGGWDSVRARTKQLGFNVSFSDLPAIDSIYSFCLYYVITMTNLRQLFAKLRLRKAVGHGRTGHPPHMRLEHIVQPMRPLAIIYLWPTHLIEFYEA
jgi:hypothetical protein